MKKELNIKTIRSIERALQLLNCFSFEENELSIKNFVEKTKLSRTTIYRILQTLQNMEYIRYNPDTDKYRLSIRLFELGSVVYHDFSIQREMSPYMDELFQHFGHTILLATLEEDRLMYLDKRESVEGLKVSSSVGKLRDPDYGIMGKLLLSFIPENDLTRMLNNIRSKRTEQQLADLQQKIEQARSQGYLFISNETMAGVSGVAAPVFKSNQLIAAIGALVPSSELNEEKTGQLVDMVLKLSREASKAFGYQGEDNED